MNLALNQDPEAPRIWVAVSQLCMGR